ncbi:hypothetical protein TrVE_jg8742 [Triparma verrucosa]|uniref:PH domain-containing protein n=2 Tax=Triparma verrucosa TaxID=1606542 RepID=A0A9W7B5C3_9STRA|nr:hypothetical protein TrVE_jg8742 [Triparma verrucosa]
MFHPFKRILCYCGKIGRTLKMSSGYEKDLMPYLGKVVPHLPVMIENVEYVEPVFPQMIKYMSVFGPHLDVVLPNMDQMGPHLGKMMPLMDRMEPYMDGFMPHLVACLPHMDIMIDHMEDFLPHFDKIVPNLGQITPHMGIMMKHIDSFMPHMEIIMRNFHFIVPTMGIFMEHIEALLPTLDKTMPYLDGMAPHFEGMAPSLPKFVPIMDRVIDHLPSIIPRLGDTLVNADAVLDYLGWTVNTPLVNSLEMHGTGSTVVKIGRALGGSSPEKERDFKKQGRRASEVAVSLAQKKKLEDRIVMEGWIKKRSTSAMINSLAGKAWKRKWVVIDVSGCMSIYTNPSKSPQSLRMRWYLGGTKLVPQEVGKSFKLKCPKRGEIKKITHYFRVPKGEKVEAEYNSWITQIKLWDGSASIVKDEGYIHVSDGEDEEEWAGDDEDNEDEEDEEDENDVKERESDIDR